MSNRDILRPRPGNITAGATGLQKINLLTAWAFAVELGGEAPFAWEGPYGDGDDAGERGQVVDACARLKHALTARGDLSGNGPLPVWAAYSERFARYCPPGPLLTDRAVLSGILLCFAHAAVDLSGAARLAGAVPSPLATRGAAVLLAGLTRIKEWHDGTRPRLAAAEIYNEGDTAIRLLRDVCRVWPAEPAGTRVIDPRGFRALPEVVTG